MKRVAGTLTSRARNCSAYGEVILGLLVAVEIRAALVCQNFICMGSTAAEPPLCFCGAVDVEYSGSQSNVHFCWILLRSCLEYSIV